MLDEEHHPIDHARKRRGVAHPMIGGESKMILS